METEKSETKERNPKDGLPSGPVAKTLHSQCRGLGSVPGLGTRSHLLQLRV